MIQARQELNPTRTRGSPTMNVRSQVSMVFHLDKCIGCHTCSHRLQEHLDRPQGRRVHVVEQRRDQTRHRLSHAWEDQEQIQRRLGGERTASCGCARTGKGRIALQHLSQPAPCPAWTTTTSPGPTTTRTCSTRLKAPTSRRRGRSRWSPASRSTSRPGRTGTTIWAARRSTPRTIPTSKASPRSSAAAVRASSGWCSSTCRASAITA